MTTNNLYQVLLVKKVNYEVNIVSLLALMLLMVSFIIPNISLAADSITSRDPKPIDTAKPVEEVKPVETAKPIETTKPAVEVQPVETADPLQNEPSEAEAPQAQVCPPLCGDAESLIPNYDTNTGVLSIPAVSVDNSETSTFTVEMNKQSEGEFIFGLTKAKPIKQSLKVSMCNGGSWFPVPTPINLTEQDLITGNTQFPGTGTDANRAYYIASNICDSQFTVPAPNSMNGIANAGLSMVHTITGPSSYLASNNSNYSFSDGLEFTCKRCGVATEVVTTEEVITLPPTDNGNKGMTWEKMSTSLVSGIVDVGCGYSGNDHNCNPYQGDTSCSVALPVLCINKQFSSPKPSWVQIPNIYHSWAGGVVATTPPVAPASEPLLSGTITDANQYCENQFGSGWQVAEFHDGWGWYFKAYGNVGTAATRFWVDINDQNANCWTH